MSKALTVFLSVIFLSFQYRLWIGEGSVAHIVQLNEEISRQGELNTQLVQRNDKLYSSVTALKTTLDAVEGKARSELGMIRKGETFYLVVD